MDRQVGLPYQAAVCQVARRPGQPVGQDLFSHAAPETIGRDKHIRFHPRTSRGLHGNGRLRFTRILDTRSRVQPHAVLANGLQQCLLQVCPVHSEIRCAVALLERADLQRGEFMAIHGIAHAQPLRTPHKGGEFAIEQTPSAQDGGGIGAELDAGAHLGEFGCLFQHACFPACLARGQCRRQAAQAAACDQDFALHAASS